jgi:hypothetical protein
MAQSSFALFFLLVLAAGAAAMVSTLRESWSRIAAALAASPSPAEPAPLYSTSWTPAAEVPRVAGRLLLHELDEPLPPAKLFAAWTVEPMPERTGPQLGFAFL